jgi:hypothetical protein
LGSVKSGISLAGLGAVGFSRRDYLDQESSSEHGNESLGWFGKGLLDSQEEIIWIRKVLQSTAVNPWVP